MGAKTSWRDRLDVHPACALFEPLPPDEIKVLADDITKNGLQNKIDYTVRDGKTIVIDGQNRLSALELGGIIPIFDDEGMLRPQIGGRRFEGDVSDAEIVAYVISQNSHRRHLSVEQRKEIAAALLKIDPAKSNRAVAAVAKVDDKTVASVRKGLEVTAEIPQLKTTKGKDGKSRPAQASLKPAPSTIPLPKVPGPKPAPKAEGLDIPQFLDRRPHANARAHIAAACLNLIDDRWSCEKPHTVIGAIRDLLRTLEERADRGGKR